MVLEVYIAKTITEMKLPSPRYSWNVLKRSFQLFYSHDTFTHGAALSFYMVFSIAPILIIVISVAGSILGPEAIQGEVKRQLQAYISTDGAKQIQDIIAAAYKPGKNWIATVIAIVILLIGATSVFVQLRTALNTIWDVNPSAKKTLIRFFLTQLFSMGMIACLAFLLLVSLIIHTGLEALMYYWSQNAKILSTIAITVIDFCLSIGITTLLFAVIYKYMSDARPQWRSVWLSSIITAILFAIGKYLIGLYVGKSGVASSYGAASSVVLILVWVFYSSQIVFYGAELTRALALQGGWTLDSNAIPSNQETKVTLEEVLKEKATVKK